MFSRNDIMISLVKGWEDGLKIADCNKNIYATKKRTEEVKELINIAEVEVDVEKFNSGRLELQKLENALELYNNQYERLVNEKPLDAVEAKEIFIQFNKTIEKEDKKLNQEALQHIKALRELANKSNNIFIDYAHTPDAVINVLKTVSKVKNNGIITIIGCGGKRDKEKRQG